MPNPPLDALRKATSIGPDPQDINNPEAWKLGVMPFLPSLAGIGRGVVGAAGRLRNVLGPLVGRSLPEVSNVVPGASSAVLEGLQRASQSARDLMNNPSAMNMMDRLYQEANPIFRGLEESGTFAGPRTVGGLRHMPVAETLGEVSPEFTPQGGEALYNVGKGALGRTADPMESVYAKIMSRMGR